jgi:hypothetical protein
MHTLFLEILTQYDINTLSFVEIVMVTHDESTFYANDGKEKGWFLPGEIQLKPKGPGLSIMISEFQCSCHGTMRYNGMVSRTLFYAGANREGYWTSDDLVKQLREQVIPIFNGLHPGCKGLFLFDQSSNHTAFSSDALVASRMQLAPKRYRLYKGDKPNHDFKDTTYVDKDGNRKTQTFFTYSSRTMADGTPKYAWFKGAKAILEERGLWHDEDTEQTRKGRKWRLKCGSNGDEGSTECCAQHCLANQPDFKAQQSALHEILYLYRYILEFYPKFHCECNWIERYWADVKRDVRSNCDYTFAGLKNRLPIALDAASPDDQIPTKIRRYYHRCWRYIEAYRNGKNADGAYDEVVGGFVSRVESSHRRLHADE